MNFIQHDLGYRQAGEVAVVTLEGTEATVELLDTANLAAFKASRRHTYYGGHYRQSPAHIPIPSSGRWYVVVHLGGHAGRIRSGVTVLSGALP